MVTTHRDERGRRTVYDLLPAGLPWVFPAGRLDADSEGLLVLTSDSELAVHLTDPEHHLPKTYHVEVTGVPSQEALANLSNGLVLADGPTWPARVRVLRQGDNSSRLEVVLTEGRNRQVRRMLRKVGHRVKRLVRVAIGGLELGDLPAGSCRDLHEDDLRRLLQR